MRWFVTGADRFVGRAVVRAATARGDSVLAAVRPGASKFAETSAESLVEYVEIDWDHVSDESLATTMKGCDVVAHTDIGDPWSLDRAACERAVLVRTEQVADGAKKAGVRRVILRSSERVTASGEVRRMVEESLGHSYKFLSPWDEMLSIAEGIVCSLSGETEGVALRAAFVWGDGDDESLPRFRALASQKALTLPAGGDQSFCTTHADNLAQAFLCAADAESDVVAGNAYWAVDEEITTAKRFLTKWLVTAGAKGPRSGLLPYSAARLFSWLDERNGGMSAAELAAVGVALSVDTKRTRAELGYEPKVSIVEGLSRMAKQSGSAAQATAISAEK
ncbi:MAG: NAD(P)-dependent oxidoreductase [Myxococcales bacterium]|nr:NAD(P)-dependent oxidoreductase [Myxococcales bacterium]